MALLPEWGSFAGTHPRAEAAGGLSSFFTDGAKKNQALSPGVCFLCYPGGLQASEHQGDQAWQRSALQKKVPVLQTRKEIDLNIVCLD